MGLSQADRLYQAQLFVSVLTAVIHKMCQGGHMQV